MPSERVILIDIALTRAQRNGTLAHELAHIDLGHIDLDGWFGRRFERDADRLAAGRLLADIEPVADAIAVHPLSPVDVAEHLDVPESVLYERLTDLTDAEAQIIEDRVAAVERPA